MKTECSSSQTAVVAYRLNTVKPIKVQSKVLRKRTLCSCHHPPNVVVIYEKLHVKHGEVFNDISGDSFLRGQFKL